MAGPAVLSFGAVIARTSRMNQAHVWIVHPTHAKNLYCNDFKPQCVIVKSSTSNTVSNVVHWVVCIDRVYNAI